jgi:hypothetical protein
VAAIPRPDREAEREINDIIRERERLIQNNENAQERYIRRLETLGRLVERSERIGQPIPDETVSREANAALEELERSQQRVQQSTQRTSNTARELGLTFSSAFEDAIIKGESFSKVLQGILQDIARIVVRRTITEPLGTAVTSSLRGFDFASIFSGIGSALGGLFRAEGGPVAGGQPYIVGERGPEWFVPNRSGTVLPNGMAPGGGVNLQLAEEDPAVWAWNPATDERATGQNPSVVLPNPGVIAAPATILVETPLGTTFTAIAVSWSAVGSAYLAVYEIEFCPTSVVVWQGYAGGFGGTAVAIPTAEPTAFRVRAQARSGAVSGWREALVPAAASGLDRHHLRRAPVGRLSRRRRAAADLRGQQRQPRRRHQAGRRADRAALGSHRPHHRPDPLVLAAQRLGCSRWQAGVSVGLHSFEPGLRGRGRWDLDWRSGQGKRASRLRPTDTRSARSCWAAEKPDRN